MHIQTELLKSDRVDPCLQGTGHVAIGAGAQHALDPSAGRFVTMHLNVLKPCMVKR